jgi:hypothetical protein
MAEFFRSKVLDSICDAELRLRSNGAPLRLFFFSSFGEADGFLRSGPELEDFLRRDGALASLC